jgi:hypothetical protein
MHVFLQPHSGGLFLLPFLSLVSVVQVVNFSLCSVTFINASLLLNLYIAIPRFVLGATLLVLAVIQALKQLVEMYKATKQWQLNQCIQQLVRDGILYFLMYVLPLPSFAFPFLTHSSHSRVLAQQLTTWMLY